MYVRSIRLTRDWAAGPGTGTDSLRNPLHARAATSLAFPDDDREVMAMETEGEAPLAAMAVDGAEAAA